MIGLHSQSGARVCVRIALKTRWKIRDNTPPQSKRGSHESIKKKALIERPSQVTNLKRPERNGDPRAPIARDIW
jgi:hypothetical protein